MQRTPQRDTPPERRLRSVLHARGLRFRIQEAPLRGLRRHADIVFRADRVAVFVDGCFWHACEVHGTLPKANRPWWQAKLEDTRRRDEDTDARLVAAGWEPVRVWEHEDPVLAAERIHRVLLERR